MHSKMCQSTVLSRPRPAQEEVSSPMMASSPPWRDRKFSTRSEAGGAAQDTHQALSTRDEVAMEKNEKSGTDLLTFGIIVASDRLPTCFSSKKPSARNRNTSRNGSGRNPVVHGVAGCASARPTRGLSALPRYGRGRSLLWRPHITLTSAYPYYR
jgi:hypothetical protein